MNLAKLRGKLKEKGVTHKEVAAKDCWDCAVCTVSQRVNGVRPIALEDADKIGRKLDFTPQDFYEVFFG